MVTNHGGAPKLRVVVHIGPVKTGSTAFTHQMIASQNRGDLGETIVYALPREIRRDNESRWISPQEIRHLAPKLEWDRQSGEDRPSATTSRHVLGARTYLDGLAKDLRARMTSDTTVVTVEEALSRRPHPGNLTSELLARFDAVDYVFVARAQQFIVPSAMSQRLKSLAHPNTWDTRVSNFLSNKNLANQFDYGSILDRWASSDPRVRLIAVPFLESDRGTQKLFYRILSAVGVRADLGERHIGDSNVTPSRFEIAAIQLYKKATIGYPRKRGRRNRRRFRPYDLARLVFRLIARIIRSPRWAVTPDEQKSIVDFYQPCNMRFRERLGAQAQSAEWTEWFQHGAIHHS